MAVSNPEYTVKQGAFLDILPVGGLVDYGYDADGDPVELEVHSNVGEVSLEIADGNLLATADPGFEGTAVVTLTATDRPDGRGRSDELRFVVTFGEGIISGAKYEDLNGSGERDPGERG